MKNLNLNILWVITLPLLFFFTACEKEGNKNPDTEVHMLTIAEGISESGNYAVKLMSADSLFEGYNKLYVELKNTSDNGVVDDVELAFHPLMDMMTKVHAAPVEQPVQEAQGGLYNGAIVFIMPSMSEMGWSLKITLNEAGSKDTIRFDLPKVRNLDEVRKITVTSESDSTTYFVSWVSPMDPEVGINDLEFTVHYKETMMSFPPAEDLTLAIEPEMPSMDHGSPNNENPVHVENGHYKGKVNFTMTGRWRVHLSIKKGSQVVKDDAYFDITFQ